LIYQKRRRITYLNDGYAKLNVEAPNLEYQDLLTDVAMDARKERKGLWRHEKEGDYPEYYYIGDKSTHRLYGYDHPKVDDITEAHKERFRTSVEGTAKGYKLDKDSKGIKKQMTTLF